MCMLPERVSIPAINTRLPYRLPYRVSIPVIQASVAHPSVSRRGRRALLNFSPRGGSMPLQKSLHLPRVCLRLSCGASLGDTLFHFCSLRKRQLSPRRKSAYTNGDGYFKRARREISLTPSTTLQRQQSAPGPRGGSMSNHVGGSSSLTGTS